jgi:hypothetical protein
MRPKNMGKPLKLLTRMPHSELQIACETVEKGQANNSVKKQPPYLKSIDIKCRYASHHTSRQTTVVIPSNKRLVWQNIRTMTTPKVY